MQYSRGRRFESGISQIFFARIYCRYTGCLYHTQGSIPGYLPDMIWPLTWPYRAKIELT